MSYVIFHYVTGVPFDMTNNSGVYDNLTLWEQIDSGAQYTPAKKWLTTLPIVLCVLFSFASLMAPARDSSPRSPLTTGRKADALPCGYPRTASSSRPTTRGTTRTPPSSP